MNAPKDIETKIAQTLEAWAELAPDKTFGGMTLAQFTAAVKPSVDARAAILHLESQMTDVHTRRETSDVQSLKSILLVVNAIRGDPTEGEDSALYEACGYVRKSARKSGLSRKAKTAPLSLAKSAA